MTALSETADKVKAFAAGGVDYITKPIEHDEALARVRTHLTPPPPTRAQEQVALKERFMRIAATISAIRSASFSWPATSRNVSPHCPRVR
jgi:DNA-binding response OmpR family regulator